MGECDWLTLHRRMGHVSLPILQQLVKNEMVAGIRVKGGPDEVLGCPTCMQAKFTRYPFSSSEAMAKAPLDEVVMDVVGPLKLGAAGAEYFLTIVDVYTHMTWVYMLSKKSNVAETDWKAENEAKIGVWFGEVKSSNMEHVGLPLELSSGGTTTNQSSLVNGGEEAKDAEEEEEEVQQVSERAPTLPSRTTSAPRIRVTTQQRHESPHVPAAEEKGRGKRRIQEWKKAMESELKTIEEKGTWELVELPEGRKAITSKWLFKIKSDADGKIERNKSRLVAKGYQQKEKVDYKELFVPVVKLTTLQILLAGATIRRWVVKQMGVTTVFLNDILKEAIFMAQPEGFSGGSGRVWKLKKALSRLKQAPTQWYLKLREDLEEIGFTPSSADHSLFMLGEGEQRSFMVVYVHDILIFSPSSDLVKVVMLKLQDKFKCKALGDYLEALAANLGQIEGHVATPFPSRFKCVKGPDDESVGEEERRRFQSLVGSLMYAAVNTRPDAAFATGQLARVVQCPNEEQVAAGMRVAKYLGQTPTVGLQYSAAAKRRQKGAGGVEPGHLFLTAFSDASYASEPDNMTSVGGFIFCVGGGPTAWESKKQVDQALSSVESEYMALFRVHGTRHSGPFMLPADWYISPSFHVSQLRPYIPATSQLS
ncbi:unnamed protein product [Closterium sp. NIES-53]